MTSSIRPAVCAAWLLAASLLTCAQARSSGARAAGAPAARRPGAIVLPSDAELRRLLAERVAAQGGGFGIVVGIVGPRGRRIVSYGRRDPGDPRPLDGDTTFEIGSVTKVFTALLFADMVRRGEVGLDEPIAKVLPAGFEMARGKGRSITFLDLATHTAGLPFMPDGAFNDAATAKEAAAELPRFLARYEPRHDAGARWDYSNVGYWLLGEALAARAGTDYASLLRTRVLAPLHLQSTANTPSPELAAKLAAGHDASLQRSPSLSAMPTMAVMPAAGGLLSTAGDLSTLLAVAMSYEPSPLAPAMAAMTIPRRPAGSPGVEQALGWVVETDGGDPLIFHDGGTFGYASAVAWDPAERVGVVVLSNQVAGVGDLARHLLRPNVPLTKPAARHREIALDPAALDACAGRYEGRGQTFLVVRQGGFLTLRLPADWGLPAMRLHPESRLGFFAMELPLRVIFEAGPDGRVNGMRVYPPRGQPAVPARRHPPEPPSRRPSSGPN
jgi:D-alanyl-D-alanine-carboxypeptidase/D-alanyl-D-alanine-endopeptidase